jgi:DNA invertase Pin-like site-specific DNA recombinase
MLLYEKRAAQYVRMSTDMQRYSLENQSRAIAVYAARRGLTIVRSYEDAGRSGLRLDGRDALKNLIEDISSGQADFTLVLVYDVSRWGRFQDSDESAYYEFICKKAGVAVEYCAEQFENDGSLTATVIKNIKRAMAGEFSRELSVKVHAGQSRIAALGYNVGAAPGYGLRRYLLDEHGNRKMELAPGQRKNIKSERVTFVRGPAREVETVQRVYDLFIDQKKSLNNIARWLNARTILNVRGRPWSSTAVRQLLSNEKYIGNSVYNRGSKKLGGKWKRNPQSEWVRKVGAFEPIISLERFEQAQQQLEENANGYTKNEMLDYLTAIWCREKHLSRDIVDRSPNGPSTNTFKNHFGSLANAFQEVGFTSARLANHQNLRRLRKAISQDMAIRIPELGGTVKLSPGCNSQLRINEAINATVVIGRTSCTGAARNQNHWRFGYRSRQKPDILIVARVDHGSSTVRDYYVLPILFLPAGSWLTVSGVNYRRLEGFRIQTLEPFYRLCARTPLDTIAA